MTDYQQKLAEVMREETEARQALVDVLRDSEAALAIAAAEHRIKKYSELRNIPILRVSCSLLWAIAN